MQLPWSGVGQQRTVVTRPKFEVQLFDDQRRLSLAAELVRCYTVPQPPLRHWPLAGDGLNAPLG